MILLIDNYDSFTYNLYHYLGLFDDVKVVKNDEKLNSVKNINNLKGIVISPGPSHPKNSLLSLEIIDFFKGKLPILGVCLGIQAIGYYFDFTIRKAKRIMHGKVDVILTKTESLLFKDLPENFKATRYHSLVVDDIKSDFIVNSISQTDNEIMGIEHRKLRIFGVQFHPESYASQFGLELIRNFVKGVCKND
ncbi:anthranilate synthase component II [Hippea alviniae]|uniref:anthranilate synthase component II n=1 Tax=Hippea alviniae TaxID=1279027 RepID=UPI0003B57229|nr:aminodeoxychorismate/anthranilate synthase component II [Hippea alviniae]